MNDWVRFLFIVAGVCIGLVFVALAVGVVFALVVSADLGISSLKNFIYNKLHKDPLDEERKYTEEDIEYEIMDAILNHNYKRVTPIYVHDEFNDKELNLSFDTAEEFEDFYYKAIDEYDYDLRMYSTFRIGLSEVDDYDFAYKKLKSDSFIKEFINNKCNVYWVKKTIREQLLYINFDRDFNSNDIGLETRNFFYRKYDNRGCREIETDLVKEMRKEK